MRPIALLLCAAAMAGCGDRARHGVADTSPVALAQTQGGDERFTAAFAGIRGTAAFVEVRVEASAELSAVEVSLDGGPWQALNERTPGSWGGPIDGAGVTALQFRARGSGGDEVLSEVVAWPPPPEDERADAGDDDTAAAPGEPLVQGENAGCSASTPALLGMLVALALLFGLTRGAPRRRSRTAKTRD